MPKKYLTREIVVTPKGNYTIPSLESYIEEQAFKSRSTAASHILQQTAPNIPIIPSRAPWSIAAAIIGMSDEERIKYFGTADPETCIYTATSQFNDRGAKVSGNKTFRRNPDRFGFEEIPIDSVAEGDLVQFSDERLGPHHSVLMTGRTFKGEPTLSYSNGNSVPYTVYEGDTIPTMKKNERLSSLSDALGTPTAFRYIGSPQKQMEWKQQYFSKYNLNSDDYKPNFNVSAPSHTEQPDALKVTKPIVNILIKQMSEGGSLYQPKNAWENLSMREKAAMIKVAVSNGITNLQEIKDKYNEFAEGGKIHIKDSKKGTFTAAATKHGMGVQEFASKVLANKDNY